MKIAALILGLIGAKLIQRYQAKRDIAKALDGLEERLVAQARQREQSR